MPAVHAWATPVDAAILGAHLEAYVKTVEIFNTLRLCHRFGQGSNVSIKRLPVELIISIEEEILAAERQRTIQAWTADFNCFQQRCEPIDHLDEKQLEIWTTKMRGYPWPFEQDSGMTEEDFLQDLLWEAMDDEWVDKHYNQRDQWEDRVGMKGAAQRDFFSEHKDLVNQRFGLEICTSQVRYKNYVHVYGWSDVRNIWPAETTISYLKLPDAESFFDRCKIIGYERDDKGAFIASGYSTSVVRPGPLSAASRAKFKRIMEILDLKPCPFHADMRKIDKTAADRQNDGSNADDGSWPKFTLLTGPTAWSDEISQESLRNSARHV